ncbi:MAG: PilZ domain-containing protein [Desulfatibacillaceae bacterium]
MSEIMTESERRKYPRISGNISIQITDTFNPETGDYAAADEKTEDGTPSKDISAGGMCFFSASRLEPRTRLNLKIKIEGWAASTSRRMSLPIDVSKVPLMAMGEVVWCRAADGGDGYEVGVKFIDIFEDDHKVLKKYLQDT